MLVLFCLVFCLCVHNMAVLRICDTDQGTSVLLTVNSSAA